MNLSHSDLGTAERTVAGGPSGTAGYLFNIINSAMSLGISSCSPSATISYVSVRPQAEQPIWYVSVSQLALVAAIAKLIRFIISPSPSCVGNIGLPTPSMQSQMHELAKTLPPPRKQNIACDACRYVPVIAHKSQIPTKDGGEPVR